MQKLYRYYPEAEKFQIDTFEELIDNLQYLTPNEMSVVEKAYEKAEYYHRNSKPRVATGKPYITHPLSVANLVASYQGNYKLICGALLHDTVEDTEYTIREVEEDFGKDIAEIVDTVTKISTAKEGIDDKDAARDATHRKILESVSKYGINGIYGIMLKIADRIDNIQSLDGFKESKKIRIATETMHIYVPLARISGIYEAKDFLENASLMNIDPKGFEKFYYLRQDIIEASSILYNEFCEVAADLLSSKNIEFDFELKIKNLYGIYKQIVERGKELEQINDTIGMKLIVPTKDDCYKSLGVIHQCGVPVKGYFDDYIAKPKLNGYRSLNTLIRYKNSRMQVRIRTDKMQRCNRLGLLNSDNPFTPDIIKRIQSNVAMINKDHPSDKEFLLQAEHNILTPVITILSPTGKRVIMHDGDTALDYALKTKLVNNQNEIDRIYVNGKRLEVYSEKLCDEDLVYVLRRED